MGEDKENSTQTKEVAQKSSQRWTILRNAIVKSSSNSTHKGKSKTTSSITTAAEGSIHQFEGFDFLHRQRLPRRSVSRLQDNLTNISWHTSKDLVTALELSLLALTALKPAQWVWDFYIEFPSKEEKFHCQTESETPTLLCRLEENLQSSASEPLQRLRLGKGSYWVPTEKGREDDTTAILKIKLAPFLPSQGIFQYTLPSFDGEGREVSKSETENAPDQVVLLTRERLNTASTSLRELTSHHHHQGVDNTGNICVWDSEQTMAFSLLKHLAMHDHWSNHEELDILELGAGMAGLAGLSVAQKLRQELPHRKLRLWLTDGHPQAVKNNQVHAHMMHLRDLQKDSLIEQTVNCLVLPWSMDPPSKEELPPPCHVALVSDCTHFQEFHVHLFFTLAYGVRVRGYVYLCQPHRGTSLERFLDVVRATSDNNNASEHNNASEPLFSIQWMAISELQELDAKAKDTNQAHYDPNIHYPHWILLRKLRDVQEKDRGMVLEHMRTRDH